MNAPKYHKDQSVTAEANKLVYGDRGDSYAHPLTDYEATAKIWSGVLGVPVTAYQAALCMVGVKLSRASRNVGHRDSLVDGAGYFEVANEIHLAEKDKKQPQIVAWGLAKPKSKFKEGETVLVHDMVDHMKQYNGQIYKVMGDWGPTCVFVGNDAGERLCFDQKNLCKYDVPKFEFGDYVRLTPEAFKESAPWVTKHGNTNRKVLGVRKGIRHYGKAEEYYYIVKADPCTAADNQSQTEYLWEDWLVKTIFNAPKFKPGQVVRFTHEDGRKEFVWVQKTNEPTPWQNERSYVCHDTPCGGRVYYIMESSLEAA
jgi:hypothetical protein